MIVGGDVERPHKRNQQLPLIAPPAVAHGVHIAVTLGDQPPFGGRHGARTFFVIVSG
jgi:hypothetical protein